tara:strand:+ start:200 stop:814 length:615 start_codon:yes stop_codon:yes gene_type:complete
MSKIEKEPVTIVNPNNTLKNLDFFLKIPQGISITAFIVILGSIIFNILDMEIVGHFMLAFSIFLSFMVLLSYKMFINKEARKNNDLSNPSNIFSKIIKLLIIFKNRLPAVLIFSQFISIGVILTMIKDWLTSNPVIPSVYTRTKRFINLGLFVQIIIYFVHYSKSLKDNSLGSFNTAAFAIISLITFSLILYLYVIAMLFTVDG